MQSDLPSCRPIIVALLLFFSFSSYSYANSVAPGDSTEQAADLAAEGKLLRSLVVNEARHYLGLQYRYGGSVPQQGFDCSGFTSYVLKSFELEMSRSSAGQAQQGRAVKLEDTRPGDLILFQRSKRSRVSHVAMVVDNREDGVYIIHSTCSRGVIIENLQESSYWLPKYACARDVITESMGAIPIPILPSESLDELLVTSEQDRQAFIAASSSLIRHSLLR